MNIYLVGGAVRDQLLGLTVSDKDWVVVGATEQAMLDRGYIQVGNDFPVFLHPKTKEEYALARTERKNGKGYTGFEVDSSQTITLEQDLLRRDLTINAMAMDEEAQLIDPYNGQKDLKNKILRHISPAFSEDPLRVLRVARFAARYHHLGFQVAEETMELMSLMVRDGELDHLIAERVWKETSRALLEPAPQVFFELLRECGALRVWFPELNKLWGIPNPAKWHPEIDTGVHTMMVLQQAAMLSDDLSIRYAALVHDFGKGLTNPALWPSHRGHEKLGIEPINALSARLKVPNHCNDLAVLMSEFHSHVHRAFELKPSTILNMLNRCDAWRKPQRYQDMLTTCKADARGRTGFEHIAYEQADYLLETLDVAQRVDVQEIVSDGFKGKDIKIKLDEKRTQAIAELKRNTPVPEAN
ncbi:multifunctional CCA addition/repair protein [Aliiglaciecola sp. M165]|uniref:multifunctional CCA addition/repair protein n=1 Tax=Aliiglaciecola sp. M165 TaxID=2593649 RepID=UPI00117D6E4F|nr:multifunctional CCA addition/repair protein [Aliiglaciecola sp. M165]TRY31828.1 multifunctional CCA addition/repair protein [Aliiglaciecola sp. M165]